MCFVAGIAGWLIPVVTGIPFYIAGLVFLGIASDRMRTWINRAERRLPDRFRWKLRRALLKLPSRGLHKLLHHPEEECREEPSQRGGTAA